MTKLIKSLHDLGERLDRRMEYFAAHHPCIAFFAMFVGVPAVILAAVCAGTAVLFFPLAWVMNWL